MYQLVAVAFVHGVGGRMRVLFAVDREGKQLFGGEPAVLVEHRPGAPHATLEIEGADAISAPALSHLRSSSEHLAQLIEGAFDREGTFRREQLLGHHVELRGPAALFEHSDEM